MLIFPGRQNPTLRDLTVASLQPIRVILEMHLQSKVDLVKA